MLARSIKLFLLIVAATVATVVGASARVYFVPNPPPAVYFPPGMYSGGGMYGSMGMADNGAPRVYTMISPPPAVYFPLGMYSGGGMYGSMGNLKRCSRC